MKYYSSYNIKYEGYSKYFYNFESNIENFLKNILHYVKTDTRSFENYEFIHEKIMEI